MEDDKDVPKEFLCPISQEIMRQPTINEAGHTYDFESIFDWYASGHRTDPLTRQEIKNINCLIPNRLAESLISAFLQDDPTMQRKKLEKSDYEMACEAFEKQLQKKVAENSSVADVTVLDLGENERKEEEEQRQSAERKAAEVL